MPKSDSLSRAITDCRSSFFLADTRNCSPWICACTPFGASSRIFLAMAFALSLAIPSRIVPASRYVFPDSCGSPASSAFSEMPRLISFSLKTSSAASTRSSVSAWIVTPYSPDQEIDALVPRKSNRCDSSLAAWFSALSTSCRSTLLTTSNDESATASDLRCVRDAARGYPPRRPPVEAPTPTGRPPGGVPVGEGPCQACILPRVPSALRSTTLAGCPSGQRERSVKPSAQPTLVRTQHPPPQPHSSKTPAQRPRMTTLRGLTHVQSRPALTSHLLLSAEHARNGPGPVRPSTG